MPEDKTLVFSKQNFLINVSFFFKKNKFLKVHREVNMYKLVTFFFSEWFCMCAKILSFWYSTLYGLLYADIENKV